MRWGILLVPAVLAGCTVLPEDPIARATAEAQHGRFLAALIALDRMPPAAERYTEARTLARALERRIRTSHEKVLEGLHLRTERRDREALRRFREALDIWPDIVGARGLIQATELRLAALDEQPPAAAEAVPARPAAEPVPLAETRAAASGGDAAPSQPGPAGRRPSVVLTPLQKMRRQRLLVQVTRMIRKGEMNRARDILEDLHAECPDDPVVVGQLVRVQHQRALLAYGQGRLVAAIQDWEQVVRLAPAESEAAAFLRAARTELQARQR